jgi:hypothetical protein
LADENGKTMVFRPEISLGVVISTLTLIITIFGATGTLVWQAASIQATVQQSVIEEHNMRELENKSLHAEIGEVRTDVRSLTAIVVGQTNNKGK